jgi:hypothetical protein
MASADDPVGLGLIQSLGHPGRNFTGLSNQSLETTAKRLELLNVRLAVSDEPRPLLDGGLTKLGEEAS